MKYSKTGVKLPPSKRQKIGFQAQLLLNAGHSKTNGFQNFRTLSILTSGVVGMGSLAATRSGVING